ncbi:hypothetical protein [Ancylomarina salipaludis]|uniref:hypothetical protein n=1 Tax=Ancylomarina salipaludis TaxID=2501299 RepID=UPI0013E9891A|nr:hypothetical protein [Ancylomarina salipaludis]
MLIYFGKQGQGYDDFEAAVAENELVLFTGMKNPLINAIRGFGLLLIYKMAVL